ncbi:replication initiation protein [Acinetobacter venetianus]|uniref:replication initiation protein n=1 Tax=Acinetobacter venetianus TaxID=52133 RepID=UPI003F91FFE2
MQQLELILDQFINTIPKKPYASDNLNYGVKIYSKDAALLKVYLQPNHPYYLHNIVFDLDYEASLVEILYSKTGLPLPNLIIENKENGRSHAIYQLKSPVFKTDASRQKPIIYLNAIHRTLQHVLDADTNYTGLICKNPLNDRWRTNTLRHAPYSLDELANKLEIDWKQISKPVKLGDAVGLGRNCYLFHTVRHWAYVAIRKHRGATYNTWLQSVLDHCLKLNEGITEPLGYNEVRGISKSIARYCWKRDPHCYAMFIERQTLKGRKGGKAKGLAYTEKREQADQLKQLGLNNTQIAKQLSVDRKTVRRWLGVGQ